jgi:hypothetical protein
MSGPCFVCGKPRERISPLCDSCKEQRQGADIDARHGALAGTATAIAIFLYVGAIVLGDILL